MINYEIQIQNLSAAIKSIQEAINASVNDVAKGQMYAAQDLITAQISTLLSLEAEQSNKNSNQWDFLSDEINSRETSRQTRSIIDTGVG